MTSCHSQAFIRIVLLSHLSAFSEAVSLARLVKAEIVSPYSGILINTDVGNPTAPVATPPPSEASSKRSRGRLLVFYPFIMRPRPVSFLQSLIKSAPRPEFQHPRFQIRALRTFDNVRLRPTGPVDALLRHGRGRAKVERRHVSNLRDFA